MYYTLFLASSETSEVSIYYWGPQLSLLNLWTYFLKYKITFCRLVVLGCLLVD